MIKKMIYVHIPFCDSKCYYCNFCSAKYDEQIIESYFNKLNEEIKYNSNKDILISSIYIGGGTPSSVKYSYISGVLSTIKQCFNVCDDAEITIECNPCSTNTEKLLIYKNIGINRISFGVQSLNDICLKVIGRRHNAKKAIKAINLAKKVGFTNISADMLIGIPRQNYAILKNTAKKLIKLKLNHLSCYMLINEPNTLLTQKIESGKIKAVKEDKCVKYYEKLVKFLASNNFIRYEISNFAKEGYSCRHNEGYWNLTEYYGFGLSAHSFIENNRYENTTKMLEYLNFDFSYKKEKLSNSEIIEEIIMLSLRTEKGVSIKTLNEYGYDILESKKDELNNLSKNGFIIFDNNYIKICEDRFGVCNQIILKLLP